MSKSTDNVSLLLSRITLLTFITGFLVSALGIVLVYLGASGGNTEFSFLGQTFKSTNAGIAAIFLGATSIVLIIRRTLTSLDKRIDSHNKDKSTLQAGMRAKGKLRISDIIVNQNKESRTCMIDFRVNNIGGSDVSIDRVEFEALYVEEHVYAGFMEFSQIYDLDISKLEKKGDTIDCPISQIVKSGEADRFGIRLIAREIGPGHFRQWSLKPTLYTNFGKVSGKNITFWLPYIPPISQV